MGELVERNIILTTSQSMKGLRKKGKKIDLGLCHSMREEAEIPENIRDGIYLRHPGDEDDVGEEEVDFEKEEESREADSFKNFVRNRTIHTEEKIKSQNSSS